MTYVIGHAIQKLNKARVTKDGNLLYWAEVTQKAESPKRLTHGLTFKKGDCADIVHSHRAAIRARWPPSSALSAFGAMARFKNGRRHRIDGLEKDYKERRGTVC